MVLSRREALKRGLWGLLMLSPAGRVLAECKDKPTPKGFDEAVKAYDAADLSKYKELCEVAGGFLDGPCEVPFNDSGLKTIVEYTYPEYVVDICPEKTHEYHHKLASILQRFSKVEKAAVPKFALLNGAYDETMTGLSIKETKKTHDLQDYIVPFFIAAAQDLPSTRPILEKGFVDLQKRLDDTDKSKWTLEKVAANTSGSYQFKFFHKEDGTGGDHYIRLNPVNNLLQVTAPPIKGMDFITAQRNYVEFDLFEKEVAKY